jgi:hypothetical protein
MTMASPHHAAGVALAILLIAGACGASAQTAPPAIPFAPPRDTALKDPDNPIKRFHVDMARVEHEFPLSRQDRMKITPENVEALSQEEVDQIYGRLTAGPIPDGKYFGDLFFARGETADAAGRLKTRLGEILGGPEGRLTDIKTALLEKFGGELWKGKVFYREQRILRNMIDDKPILRPLVDDVSTVKMETVPRGGLLGRLPKFSKDDVWLLFPAKLYCGQSLLDTRRESVIVDYHFADEIEGYRPRPDSLAGRGGLRIRDEIRMVRPGFYLGRAYANRMFLLNFTLFNPDVAQAGEADFLANRPLAEDCWPASEQIRGASR